MRIWQKAREEIRSDRELIVWEREEKKKKQNLILPPLLLSNVICCETQWLLSQDVRLFFDDGVFDRYDTIDT